VPTVLVVEDDDALLYAIGRHLTGLGLSVIPAPSTMAALKVLEGDEGSTIDVLLTDIVMPQGNPHGIALSRMAKLRMPKLHVIYITGYRDVVGDPGQPLEFRMFSKPLDLDAVGAEIQRLTAS
jgi:two-component system, cell cycle response regulator CpdR